MDRSVESVIRNNAVIRPGDVFAINAPYNGGTHLPDITVCTPVFDEAGESLLFWAASRGHHADIGGIAPGSMSPLARTIEEEGVYIDNFKLVDQGAFREEALIALLTRAKYPVRNVLQNVNDLKAQIAANEKGVAGTQAAPVSLPRQKARPGRPLPPTPRSATKWIKAASSRSASEWIGKGARRSSISPAPRRSATIISTRPSLSLAPRCSTSSA